MTKVLLDSSVFISALGKPDVYSQQSRALFRYLQSKRTPIIITPVVLLEVLVNLAKQEYHIAETADLLYSFPQVPIDNATIQKAHEFLLEKPTNLKAADFGIALAAHQHQAILLTWDQKLLNNSEKYCQALTPEAFLTSESANH